MTIPLHSRFFWRSLVEIASLRQEAIVFAKVLLSLPAMAQTTVQGTVHHAEYKYFALGFIDVVYDSESYFNITYLRNHKKHRTDGPAIENENGDQYWYSEGALHRADGPAVICGKGNVQAWYVHGTCHRAYGPATVYADGSTHWFVNGERHRADGAAIELADGTREWWLHGKRHRSDGPAIEFPHGDQMWFSHGKRHRTDGPAVVYQDLSEEWWVDGNRFTKSAWRKLDCVVAARQSRKRRLK